MLYNPNIYGPNECRVLVEQGQYDLVIDILKSLKEEVYPIWDYKSIVYVIRITILNTKNKKFIDKILKIIDYEYKYFKNFILESSLSTIKFMNKTYPNLIEIHFYDDLLYRIITNYNYNKRDSNTLVDTYDNLEDKLNSNLHKVKYFITNFIFTLENITRMLDVIVSSCINNYYISNFQEIWEHIMNNLHMIKPANLTIRHHKFKEFINNIFNVVTRSGHLELMKYLVNKYRGIIRLDSYKYAYQSRKLDVIKYAMTFTPKYKVHISEYLEYFNQSYDKEVFKFALKRTHNINTLIRIVKSYNANIFCDDSTENIDIILDHLLKYITPNELYKQFRNKNEVVDYLLRHKYIIRFEPLNLINPSPIFAYIYYLGYYYNIGYELNMPIYERHEFKRQYINATRIKLSTRMVEGFMSIYPNAIVKMRKPYDITKKLKCIIRYYQLILMSKSCYKSESKIRKIKRRLGLDSKIGYYHKLIFQYRLPRTTFEHVVNINELIPQPMLVKRWKTGFRHMMNFDKNLSNTLYN